MMVLASLIRNSILKYQYRQHEGWSYSVEDNVWFYDGITAEEPTITDLVCDVLFDYTLLP